MGQLAYTAGGALVGFVVGGPTGAYWGAQAGALYGASRQRIEGPSLGDARGQFSQDGVIRGIALGTCEVGPINLIDGTPAEKRREQVGGKGGPRQFENRWYRTMFFRLCEAIPEGVPLRIWIGEKLVYDISPESTILAESQEFAQRMVFLPGGDDQGPHPVLEAIHGVGDTPYYRDSCLLGLIDYDVTQWGGAPPPLRVEVSNALVLDLPDWVAVSPSLLLQPANQPGFYFSDSGESWDGSAIQANTFNFAVSTFTTVEGRTFVSGINALLYTDGDVNSWTTVSGFNLGNNNRAIVAGLNIIYTGVGTWRVNRISPVPVNLGFASGGFGAKQGGRVVIYGAGGFGRVGISDDDGLTWSVGLNVFPTSVFSPDSTNDMTAGPGLFVAGCQVLNTSPFTWATCYSSDGLDWTLGPNPFGDPDDRVSRIWYFKGTYIAISESGKIAYSGLGTGGWALANYEFTGLVRDINDDGETVVAAGPGSGGDKIITSKDGRVWTEQPFTFNTISRLGPIGLATVSASVGEGPTLEGVVQFLRSLSPLPVGRMNATELASINVRGLCLATEDPVKSAIETLGGLYHFDTPEFDNQIHCVRRGKPTVMTIPEGHLIDNGDPIELQMRDEGRQFQGVVHLGYSNAETDYQTTKQTAPRGTPSTRSTNALSLSSPVNHQHDEAAQIADRVAKILRAEAEGTVECALPWRYLELTPSDNIGLMVSGKLRRLRIDEARTSDGEIQMRLVVDRQSAYDSEVTAVAPPPATPPLPTLEGPTRFAFLNLPALTESDDRLGYRIIAGRILPGWNGATIERSLDGDNFQTLATYGTGAVIGVLVEPLAFSPAGVVDTTRKVRLQLPSGLALESVTDAQLASRANAAAIRSSGEPEAEILQFRDVTQITDTEWELSFLPRGLLDTTPKDWPAGSLFVLLSGSLFVARGSGEVGRDVTFRAVSLGQQPDEATEILEQWAPARASLEWAPHGLVASRDGGNLSLSVTPRWRLGTDLNPIRSANFEGWRWTVDGVDYSTDAPALTIPDPGPDVPVSVRGMNRLTGPGLALEDIA